jgi:hypothetical protein
LTKKAKEQDGARSHAVKATYRRFIEDFDDRCATAKPYRKDHNEYEGLQM